MSTMFKSPFVLVLSTVFAAGAAQAGVVDLGIGGANFYSLSNFTASGSDVEGGVLVAGNLSASSYSINDKNKDAYVSHGNTGYALVVGGNLNYSSGSIKNGSYYVGGTTTTSSVGLNTASKTTASPVSFATTSAQLKNTSTSLSNVAATGSSSVAYGGMTLRGGTGNVQVFDLTSAALGSVNNFKFSNLHTNDTLILNISGTDVTLSGGYDGFKNYNVLYNFYEAKNLTFSNVGLYGSVLAPLANVAGGGGQINGSVVVGNWASNIQVNANHYFNATNVAGYVSAVPEPETYAMLLAGLGLVGFMARRRKNKSAA
ncbi:PEP-CTERM motif protein [compost metagenome]